jgi:hypothetical protein
VTLGDVSFFHENLIVPGVSTWLAALVPAADWWCCEHGTELWKRVLEYQGKLEGALGLVGDCDVEWNINRYVVWCLLISLIILLIYVFFTHMK